MTINRAFPLLLIIITIIFCKCKEGTNHKLDDNEKQALLQKGKRIAELSFNTLSQELKTVIQHKGIKEAINYCNLNALPITDSLSHSSHALIKRTSIKTRNPANIPDSVESIILKTYHEQIIKGDSIKPMVRLIDPDTVLFTSPIITMPLCLNCHGIPGETIHEDHYETIHKRYPSDQAINYQAGDLRGMWSIRLIRNK